MRKPLRVWMFYWVPAFAGKTNVGFLHSLCRRNDGCWFFAQSLKRRVQEILARHVLHAATLAGLDVLLGSCFRRNDECWFFAQSLPQERRMLVFCTVSAAGMTNVGFLHSLCRRNDGCWFFARSLKPHFRRCWHKLWTKH